MADARQWVKDVAPPDVVETIRFLEYSGYELAQTVIASSVGNGQLRFSGEFDVVITRDRGQWSLEVVTVDGKTLQLDLIAAGRAGRYPTEPIEGTPVQLPPWISWHRELPGLLEWLKSPGAREKVLSASDERYVFMWPNSPRAKSIRARWKREGLNPSP